MSVVLREIMPKRRWNTLFSAGRRAFEPHVARRRGCHAENFSSERESAVAGRRISSHRRRFEVTLDVARQYTGSGGRIESRSA
jgi:hypothetical protein